MKPILYDEFEREFDHNGIGILSDAIDVNVDQALNGTYELEMKYPVDGIHYEHIVHRTIILASVDPVSQSQPFRIYRIVPASRGTVTVYARHVAYDLMGITVSPFASASAATAFADMKANAVPACEFEFWSDNDNYAYMVVPTPKPLWALLGGSEGSVLDVFGGEYEFDKWTVNLHKHRGSDNGVSIRYGKNLTSLEQDSNIANCYTGVRPFWYGRYNYLPQLVELPEKIISAEGDFTYQKIYLLDLSSEWQEPPTEEDLRARAMRYMKDNDIGSPVVSMKVEFVRLDQTEDYKDIAILERVLLGDTVHVYFPKLNVDAYARVVKYRWKPLLDRYDSVTLGRVKANLANTIVKQQQEITEKPSVSVVQQIANYLTQAMTGTHGGSVRLLDTDGDGLPDELYIADNPDPEKAIKVWRYNYEGWAASKSGYGGPFEFGATLEGGLLAKAVTAANLTAGTIQSADAGKTVFIDLDNGIFDVTGKYNVYLIDQDGKRVHGGYVGYMSGATPAGPTDGIGVSNSDGSIYVIATEAGIRLQVGDYHFYLSGDTVSTNANVKVTGNLSVEGNISYTGDISQVENNTEEEE